MNEQQIRNDERQKIIKRINELAAQFDKNGWDTQWKECAEFMAEEIEGMEK